ncbi:serine/threonine-protein kinase [Tychonema sp. BBK16]|uniref:protein kinase domain-containing protein n=1 Tax=Tychonema sp. BBK16 TaxID=2699888 RepID=UPI001F2B6466|nr:serine/threonine protein kinase [Tychonema sp. BBK16]
MCFVSVPLILDRPETQILRFWRSKTVRRVEIKHILSAMLQPGLILQNRYRIVQELDLNPPGGFGKIFDIVEERGTPKILKVLHFENCSNLQEKQIAVSLFEREANVLIRLDHPGIPKVEPDGYFLDREGGNTLYCLVMEKIYGYNLQQWLKQRDYQPISQQQAINWLKQLVNILAYLHQQHYFHRDIKPGNIILKPDGQLVLIDFGAVRIITNTYLAKIADENQGEVTKIYTKGYAPLEQKNGKALPQSDFYALGRTFVFLLTGKNPSDLEDELYQEVIWRDKAPQISGLLADLIDQLMAFYPKNRPKNPEAILQAIAKIECPGAEGLSAVPPTELQGISPLNTERKWLKSLATTQKALVGIGITVFASITVLVLPKFVPLQGQSPAPLKNLSLLNTLKGGSELFDAVTSVAFSPDGQTLVRGSYQEPIELYNWRTGKVIKKLSRASSKLWSVAISPDGKLLATGPLLEEDAKNENDTTIKLWNLDNGMLLGTLKGHSSDVRSIAFSPDGLTIASASHDNTIKLWRVNTRELLYTFYGHTNHVTSIAFHPDGKTLASGSDDLTVKLWSLNSRKLIRTLKGHSAQVLSVAFSPDGQTLVSSSGRNELSGTAENSIKLWNPKTGELQRTLTGHLSSVWCLAISPDGQTLASGSYDNSIRLWNLRTGELLQTLTGHSNWVYSVAFSPDGQTLASGGPDSFVRIWSISH